jgi:hypothetical protein
MSVGAKSVIQHEVLFFTFFILVAIQIIHDTFSALLRHPFPYMTFGDISSMSKMNETSEPSELTELSETNVTSETSTVVRLILGG